MIVNCSKHQNCTNVITVVRPAIKVPPPKRDFQDPNPPKTAQELYARYDPSIGMGIAITLGAFLFYLLGSVAIRWIWKRVKSRLQKTKRLCKFFPAKELPPLHIAQRIAKEQGIVIPEALLIKLTARGNLITATTVQTHMAQRRVSIDRKRNFRRQSEVRRMLSRQQVATATASDSSYQKSARASVIKETIFPANTYHELPITVNIIGATPSLTPNTSDKKKLNISLITNGSSSGAATSRMDDSVDYIDDDNETRTSESTEITDNNSKATVETKRFDKQNRNVTTASTYKDIQKSLI